MGIASRLDEQLVHLASDLALSAPEDLGFGLPLSSPFGHLLAPRLVRAHPHPDDPMPGSWTR